jgi:hypothetical protein
MQDPTEKHFGDVGILDKYNNNNNNPQHNNPNIPMTPSLAAVFTQP